MADEQDDSQKTEEPTQKRLDDARKKGQTPHSREINSFFVLAAMTFIILGLGPGVATDIKLRLEPFVSRAYDLDVDPGSFRVTMGRLLFDMFVIMLVPALAAVGAVFAAQLMQNKVRFSTEPVKPKLEKISPLKGLKRLFSLRTIVEFGKGLIKISVVAIVALFVVTPYFDELQLLVDKNTHDIFRFTSELALRMLLGVLVVVFLIAALDYAYQKFEFIKNLRMTKQEIKDEYKQQEGDPLVKQRLRSIRMERARQSMMQNVPDADVVITNPTHYAVVLKYDQLTMNAPIVVAKGVDKVAARIREVAEKNDVPIVRNPPLARLLHAEADMDAEIPLTYYKAVAEVIGYVYKLQGYDPCAAMNTKPK